MSPHTSPYLPIPPHISLRRGKVARAAAAADADDDAYVSDAAEDGRLTLNPNPKPDPDPNPNPPLT